MQNPEAIGKSERGSGGADQPKHSPIIGVVLCRTLHILKSMCCIGCRKIWVKVCGRHMSGDCIYQKNEKKIAIYLCRFSIDVSRLQLYAKRLPVL